jgi:hypothetical protein
MLSMSNQKPKPPENENIKGDYGRLLFFNFKNLEHHRDYNYGMNF